VDTLYNWVVAARSDMMNWDGLTYVLHPSAVTPVIVPVSRKSVHEFVKVSGTFDMYALHLGHSYTAYPGNPIRFSVTVNLSGINSAKEDEVQRAYASAQATFSVGPQNWNPPGDRNGPFWPSPRNGGSNWNVVPAGEGPTQAMTAYAVCAKLDNELHTPTGAECWVDKYPLGTPNHLFPKYNPN
jgi:hypothetical protein